MQNRRLVLLWQAAVFALPLVLALACTIGAPANTPTPVVTPTSTVKPQASIQSPPTNSDAVVGQAITVQATGQHPDGITRIDLQANGQVVDTKVSVNPLGDPQLSVYLTYIPTVAGPTLLQVIAYRNNQPSDPASISLNVKSQAEEVTAAAPTLDTGGGVADTGPCRASVTVNGLNLRAGPGQTYTSLQVLSLGTVIPITGAIPDLSWWQGQYNNTTGWLSRYYITLFGNCNNVPAVVPPPSPTLLATITNTPASLSTPTAGLPDLTVTDITGPISVILGPDGTKTANYTITVQNAGLGAATNFQVGVTLPDGTMQILGTIDALGSGQVAIFQANILFSAPGSVRLNALVDVSGTVIETNEQNNLRSLDIIVLKPTPNPSGATPTP